jgi:hypothetical protein
VAPLIQRMLLADEPGSATLHKHWNDWLLADVL